MSDDLRLEKLGIRDNLTRLSEKVIAHMDEEAAYRALQDKRWERLEHALFGNGHKGLRRQVDDLQRTADVGIWVIGILGVSTGSLVTLMVKNVIAALHR